MSLANLSFKFYSNSALTTLAPATVQLTHQSDFSDNPQDFRVWFGSPIAGRRLQANSNPGVTNITITPTQILPERLSEEEYTLGQSIRVGSFRYIVQTAGTTAASAPTFPTAIGSTVLDGSVLWRCVAAARTASEVKLALTQAGLDTAVAGAPLVIGTELLSGAANAVEVWARVTNAVSTVSSNSAQPEISRRINQVIESVA